MYAYGPDSDVEYDIDIELLIDPDNDCDVMPSWIWDAPEPEGDDRPDDYFMSFEKMAEDAA